MNKRNIVLSLLDAGTETPYIPAGFFLHFDQRYHRGQAAIDKHLEFFNYTNMDFVKIQYELSFPKNEKIRNPGDWIEMPFMDKNFYEDQWEIVRGLVEKAGKDALVIMTLYSPYMLAGQVIGKDLVDKHIRENPDQVNKGMEIITDSLLLFVKGCITGGIDGFYHSTQGGETHRFGGSPLFEKSIKPYDLTVMEEINQSCRFNILHICDYHGGYTDLTPFLDYPGDIINANLKLGTKKLTPKAISEMFHRPFMGGLDRKGIIVTGDLLDIEQEIDLILKDAPKDFILGADCTVPSDIDRKKLRFAISHAHSIVRQ